MHQLQCTKCLNTCKTQWYSINQEEKKSPETLSYIARAFGQDSNHARNRRAREPTFLRNGIRKKNTMFRANPKIQTASMM